MCGPAVRHLERNAPLGRRWGRETGRRRTSLGTGGTRVQMAVHRMRREDNEPERQTEALMRRARPRLPGAAKDGGADGAGMRTRTRVAISWRPSLLQELRSVLRQPAADSTARRTMPETASEHISGPAEAPDARRQVPSIARRAARVAGENDPARRRGTWESAEVKGDAPSARRRRRCAHCPT